MRDDEMLDALAKVAREDDPIADPRWEQLTEGTLSERDRAELAALAETSERAKRAHAAFRPLDDAARARMTASLLAAVAKEKPTSASNDEVPIAGAPPPQIGSSPAPAPKARARGLWLAMAAAIAGIGIYVATLSPHGQDLPAYAMVVTGGEKSSRAPGEPPKTPELGPESRLEITLRPTVPAKGPIEVRAFLLRNGEARPWAPAVKVAEGGAAQVAGAKEVLFAGIEAGAWEMVLAIGRPESLPSAAAITGGSACADKRCTVLRHPIILRD